MRCLTLIATQPETGYADAGPAGNCYRLTAFDVHDNESIFALVTPASYLDVPAGEALHLALGLVRPNPTRGDRLSVEFVPEREVSARLELLDVGGRGWSRAKWARSASVGTRWIWHPGRGSRPGSTCRA